MKDKAVLEKAIQKAIDGGLEWTNSVVDTGDELGSIHDGLMCRVNDELMNIEAVIFNHDFAKALWGDGSSMILGSAPNHIESDGTLWLGGEPWKYHIQKMVIADDPIKYLGDHI